ncbi:uncharacterized protein LOC143180550 [Calliopsis andreniformis]|uniref:uncharacterized protein LOC143180550 n=1 Tax=Calliopsis andreniformis TaxID=337506 RepID=UPI003FCE68BA
MDYCRAPQWADFTHSPQLPSDNYFEIKHEVHEPQIHSKSNSKSDQLFYSCEEIEQEISSEEQDPNFYDSLESEQSVHSNVAYFVPYDCKNKSNGDKYTDDALRKGMKNLKLNDKSQPTHCVWNVSISELTTKSNKPKVKVPKKMKDSVHMREMENIPAKCFSKNNQLMNNVERKKDAVTKDKSKLMKSDVNYHPEHVKVKCSERRLSFKVHRVKSELFDKRQSFKKSQPKVLTCQYRRRSLMKYRRCSNQFISMAEAVSKFQTTTPQRFRTTSNKDLKPGPSMKVKRSPLKLTHPISPTLRCKQRTRHTTMLNQQEHEAEKIEELKRHQIKAKPVPINILNAPTVLKKVTKKPVTIIKEFNLTQPKETHHKNIVTRKEELIKKSQEQNKKTYVIRTNPIPTFKPVMVHGLSKEKLQDKEKVVANFKNFATKDIKCYDQENKQPNIIQAITISADIEKKEVNEQKLNKKQSKGVTNNKSEKIKSEQNLTKSVRPKFELNTNKRAKERSQFDEKIKTMKQEQELKRLEEERNKLAKEKLKRAELRKLTEVKTKSMPVHKPMDTQKKSTKPLTNPHTSIRLHTSRTRSIS